MRISDWSSDVCSSDLAAGNADRARPCDRRTDYDPATLHRNSRERETPMNAPLRTCHLLLTALLASAPAFTSDDARCHVGAYRLHDGAIVAISPASQPAPPPWRPVDGPTSEDRRGGKGGA